MRPSDTATDDNAKLLIDARLYASIVESSANAIITKSLDGIIQSWNAAAERMFGYTAEAAIGRHISLLIPADRADEEHWIIARMRAGERVEHYDTMRVRSDDQHVPVSLTISPVTDAAGRIVMAFKIVRDLTELREAEVQLRSSEEFNRCLMNGSADCVKVLDTDGRLLHMNGPGLCAMEIDDFGPLHGKKWADLWPADTRADIERSVTKAVGGEVSSFEVYCPTNTGAPKWWEVAVSPVRDAAGGRVVRILAVSRDITDRKRAEERLRASEAEFRAAFEQSAVGIGQVCAKTGRIVRVNAKYCELTGYSAEALAEMTPADLTFAEDRDIDVEATGRMLRGESAVYDQEKRYVRKDGTIIWVHVNATMVHDADGRSERTLAVIQDITARKDVEQSLRDSEQRMRLATEATSVGIWEWNILTHTIRWDSQMFRIYGIAPTLDGFVEYSDWNGALLSEDLPENERILQDALRRSGSRRREFHILRRDDGEQRLIEAVETVRTNAQGQTEWVVGSNMDVTDRRRVEKALRESNERYRSATAAVSDLLWTNTADGLMEGEQPGWQAFTGQSREEYQGYGWSKAVHPEDAQATIEAWNRAVAEKRTFEFEHRVRHRDGEWRVCSVRALPILNADGTIREWVGVHTDITERRRDEEKLLRLAAELSEADRNKDEFLATLAHELRNPLAPIHHGLQLMKLSGAQKATVEQARAMMERQLSQMVRLVDDLMDVSRISRSKLELRKERLPLAAVLDRAVETSRPLIEQMGHELTVTVPKQPLIVDADMTRLAQVFLNLLNNAAKYGDRGGHIQLNVERQGSDVVVTVKDTGIGIAADQLPRIFEMFMQVDRSLEQSQSGLGIGLTLVKRLVEMHGGRVEAKSEGPGAGSEFEVRLPIAIEASMSTSRAVSRNIPSAKG